MYHQLTTVVTSAAGTQDGAVDASAADLARESAHIQVHSGVAWVSCYDLQAVACHAAAWHAAQDAGKALPDEARTRQAPARMVGSVIVRARGLIQPHVYNAADSDQQPYVEVIVGPLRTRAYDQAAIGSITATWARALNLALALWSTRADTITTPGVQQMLNRGGIKKITRDGLPPKP